MSKRMHLVDDDQDTLTAMCNYLHGGYGVDSATDRRTAQLLLASFHYEVVIVDLKLGGATNSTEGLDIIDGLRGRAIRSIVITAHGSPEIEARAHDCGADAVLHKPQRLADIAAWVAKLTRSESASMGMGALQ